VDQSEKKGVSQAPAGDLGAIVEECMDAPGYVIFVGVLSNERNSDGNVKINFKYRRYHFAIEDVAKGLVAFKQHMIRDLEKKE